jgi:hypothetical protein
MSQSPGLPAQPRLRSLARLEAEIVKAEADRARWTARAAGLRARRRDDRAELALAGIAAARLEGLNRSRAVLLEGDAGRDDPEPEAG